MRKVCAFAPLGMTTLSVMGDCWHYGPVLAYKGHASHDSQGPCWQGGCVREEFLGTAEGDTHRSNTHRSNTHSPMFAVLS